MFGTEKNGPQKLRPQKFGPKNLVKIGSVTAEILLTSTNVARAYGAWTNISMTVGMCQKKHNFYCEFYFLGLL